MDGEEASRFLEAANDLYREIEFSTNSIYNEPAPEAWISFLIGGILSIIGGIMWLRRLHALQKTLNIKLRGTVLLRAMISVAIDSDEPFYTIVSFAAFAFLFLGGLQLDYEITFSVMLGTFALSAAGDSIRVLLAFKDAASLADVIVTSDIMKSKLRNVSTELKPHNVYEDLGRGKTIVIMVFITQVILISFVVTDIFETETHTCPDGTRGCPVVGTLGSWGLYVLGIFMACVFLLGPKTSFGQSEQNPSYWLQLLLAAKQTGARCTWNDPVANEIKERILTPNDWTIWVRFFMSFLINGVGFHILVHALPIQVAGQSSLTGVVFRAVGMMYLVDLDDTPGYTLKLVESKPEGEPGKEDPMELDDVKTGGKTEVPPEEEQPQPEEQVSSAMGEATTTTTPPNFETTALSEEVQRILDEARLKIDALGRNGVNSVPAAATNNPGGAQMAMGLLVLAGGTAGVNGIVHGGSEDGGDEAAAAEEAGGDAGGDDGGAAEESIDLGAGGEV